MEKKLSYRFCFADKVFYLFLSSVNYRRIYCIYFKKSRFVEEVLFYLKNKVVAFRKIEIKWDWVSDIHVYI